MKQIECENLISHLTYSSNPGRFLPFLISARPDFNFNRLRTADLGIRVAFLILATAKESCKILRNRF